MAENTKDSAVRFPSWFLGAEKELSDPNRGALEKYCTLKRMAALVKTLTEQMLPQSNLEFATLVATSDRLTKYPVGGFAALTHNAPPGTWTFSEDIVKMQRELQSKIASYKKTHKDTAYKTAEPDPFKTALFKVSLTAGV